MCNSNAIDRLTGDGGGGIIIESPLLRGPVLSTKTAGGDGKLSENICDCCETGGFPARGGGKGEAGATGATAGGGGIDTDGGGGMDEDGGGSRHDTRRSAAGSGWSFGCLGAAGAAPIMGTVGAGGGPAGMIFAADCTGAVGGAAWSGGGPGGACGIDCMGEADTLCCAIPVPPGGLFCDIKQKRKSTKRTSIALLK